VPRFMTKKVILTLGLALILAAGGLATASNMGFKFVKNYSAVSPDVNTVSLPYFQSQFTNVQSVFNNIPGVTQVCRINPTEARDCWLGDYTGSLNFPIVSEDGLIVGVSAAITQIVVGSHNPSLALSLNNVAPDINFKSLPYHMTYTTVQQVFNDITGVTQVCRINPNESKDCWLGDYTGSLNWNPVIGDAVVIGVSAATTWTPDHY